MFTIEKLSFTVTKENEGQRIDKFLAEKIKEQTRAYLVRLIEDGEVILNGRTAVKSCKLKENDYIELTIPAPVQLSAQPENIPLDILFEDEHLLVVNKPKGMVVHPAAGNYSGTLVNALLYHCGDSLSGINGVLRPGIVHRIDKNTSGLLIVAKSDIAHRRLAQQIKEHSFTRQYMAVVYGNLKTDTATVNAPIGRSPKDRKKMCVTDKNSKPAVTHYEVTERFNGFTQIRVTLETGRTHQIRVHMAYIGHPVAGDDVYGPKKVITKLNGQCLHAGKIGFIHPITNQYLEFSSPLPEYFESFLSELSKQTYDQTAL